METSPYEGIVVPGDLNIREERSQFKEYGEFQVKITIERMDKLCVCGKGGCNWLHLHYFSKEISNYM